MKLYYSPLSPNCRKVRALCEHIKFPIENLLVDVMAGQTETPDYLAKNPNGMVPVLEDGGNYLWESNAIMQLIAEKAKNTQVWPTDPWARADITRWQSWELAHLASAAVYPLAFENFFKPMMKMTPDQAVIEQAKEAFKKYATVLDGQLKGRKHLVGSTWTLADFSVGAVVSFCNFAKAPIDEYRNLRDWYSGLEALDAWKKTAYPQLG